MTFDTFLKLALFRLYIPPPDGSTCDHSQYKCFYVLSIFTGTSTKTEQDIYKRIIGDGSNYSLFSSTELRDKPIYFRVCVGVGVGGGEGVKASFFFVLIFYP